MTSARTASVLLIDVCVTGARMSENREKISDRGGRGRGGYASHMKITTHQSATNQTFSDLVKYLIHLLLVRK